MTRAIVLTLILLLGSAPLASAECAWALRGQAFRDTPFDTEQEWTFYGGLESREKCMADRKRGIEQVTTSMTQQAQKDRWRLTVKEKAQNDPTREFSAEFLF